MSQNISVSKEEIKKARQANLAEYLLSKGVQLTKVGRRFKSNEHDSLVFTGNAYYWNSRQEHGNALDYVTKHMKMDFTAAVKELSIFNSSDHVKPAQEFKINDIELNPNIQRSIAYLNKSRNIDYKVIQDLIKSKLLFQSKEGSNIVFPIKDEKGNVVGAELNGTLSERRYKGIAENSAYGYGFNFRTSDIKNLKNYMFFESGIDMLSYINIQLIEGNLNAFKDTLFTSMGGLKSNVVEHTLKTFKSDFEPNIYLCVDNINIDKAAKTFCETICNDLKDKNVVSMICSSYPKESNRFPVAPEGGKDWNDQLTNIQKKSVKEKLSEIKSTNGERPTPSEEKGNKSREPCR